MSYYSRLDDTLLVGTLDLQLSPGIVVENLDGLHAPGTRRGGNDIIPGRAGQIGATKPLDAYSFTVPITLLPMDETGTVPGTLAGRRAAMLANLRDIAAVASAGYGLITLTRRLSTATGYVETSAAGEFVDGLAIALLNPQTGRTELNFINLDGCWHSTTDVTAHPGTITVSGDIPTRSITLTLPGAGTLTNATLGISVTVTTGATLDVVAYVASAGLATMATAGDDAWFALAPGANVITWDGTGTPDIVYRPAYL